MRKFFIEQNKITKRYRVVEKFWGLFWVTWRPVDTKREAVACIKILRTAEKDKITSRKFNWKKIES